VEECKGWKFHNKIICKKWNAKNTVEDSEYGKGKWSMGKIGW